jgi:orotidine-5'-phosphate decarboxylase
MSGPRIIVALDCATAVEATGMARSLDPALCRVKVGKELFTATGPALVEDLMGLGFEVFLDLKYHDIPTTVAHACKSAARLGVWMMDVHCTGGRAMLRAAREALEEFHSPPLLIGVTVLTSMEKADLVEIGFGGEPEEAVLRLAGLARDCGLDGVVCSPREATALRRRFGKDFRLVTPGIRPASATLDDQVRVMTPRAALEAGADYLVIGRPVTRASEPLLALREISAEMELAEAPRA